VIHKSGIFYILGIIKITSKNSVAHTHPENFNIEHKRVMWSQCHVVLYLTSVALSEEPRFVKSHIISHRLIIPIKYIAFQQF